jgi:DNA-binding CsgD family transcriptional regulator/tetratricopeptide (TPR) repeat protein
MALLEREEPLASLAACADEARLGHGRLVLVAGEAGVGKSALIEEFTVGLTGARCYLGACDGLFTPRPLGAFLDIAGQFGGKLAELAGRCDAPTAREELFGLLPGELSDLGKAGGVCAVVVEDIHWADEATLDLLRFVARRIGSLPVLLIATYRDDELAASYPLRMALGDLAVQRCTRRVDLAPLSAAAVAALSAGSRLDAAELYRVTGGNPFYVTETLRTGLDQVPRSAVDAVLARVAGLGPGARDVLHAAALIGSVVEPWLLEQAADCPPSTVDELVDRGLLAADGAVLRFRHEIARRAVAQEIPAHRQPTIHARLLAALLAAGSADHARLAFHAEAAGDAPATLEHATLAGQHAAGLGSHREAAAQFERALGVADGEPPAVLAGRYQALADELSVIDGWDTAAAAYERALSLWRAAGDPVREGEVLCKLSGTLWRLCRGKEAGEASEAAVRVLEPLGPSVELARAYASVAADLAGQARFAETMTLAGQAQTLAASAGAFGLQVYTLNLQSWAVLGLGGDGVPLLEQALDIALSHGAAYEAGHTYTNLHEINCTERRYAASEPHYLAGITHCEEQDLGVYLTCLQGVRTTTLERLGRWDEAVALAEVVLARMVSSPVNRMFPQGTLGRILARRGAAGAWRYLDEAMAAADGTGDPQYVVPMRLGLAEAYWLAGDLGAAHQDAVLAGLAAADGAYPWLRGEAAAWIRRTGTSPIPAGEIAAPYRMELDGDWRGAAKAHDDLGCSYDAALALLDSGEEEALRRALDICQDLGAVATARLVRRTMRKRGIRSIPVGQRAATRRDPIGLTRREREVLALLCAGRTDAEIGAELFISAKTASHHVSAVLGKLGVSNRRAAANQAARLGLTGDLTTA